MEETAQELTLSNAVERLVGSVNRLSDRTTDELTPKETGMNAIPQPASKVRQLAQMIEKQSNRIDEIIRQLPI